MRIILLGPPGAGKGTQARRLADRYGLAVIAERSSAGYELSPGTPYPGLHQLEEAGDVSRLGLDRVVVTAYSKDARDSFDVLTASIAP